jgi:hypothetical protein
MGAYIHIHLFSANYPTKSESVINTSVPLNVWISHGTRRPGAVPCIDNDKGLPKFGPAKLLQDATSELCWSGGDNGVRPSASSNIYSG